MILDAQTFGVPARSEGKPIHCSVSRFQSRRKPDVSNHENSESRTFTTRSSGFKWFHHLSWPGFKLWPRATQKQQVVQSTCFYRHRLSLPEANLEPTSRRKLCCPHDFAQLAVNGVRRTLPEGFQRQMAFISALETRP